MSFFSGLLSAAGPIIGAATGNPAIGAGISALGGALGQDDVNDTNRYIADQNNATSIELANSAYQRRVADLKAAGLNPMLAYTQGGAQVPALQQARIENSAASSADIGMKAMSSALLKEQIKTQESQTELNSANAAAAAAEARMKNISANAMESADRAQLTRAPGEPLTIDVSQGNYGMLEQAKLVKSLAEVQYENARANNDFDTLEDLNRIARGMNYKNFDTMINSNDFEQRLVDLSRSYKHDKLLGFKLPEGKAMAHFWEGAFGSNIAPYLNSASNIVDILSDILPQKRAMSLGIKLGRKLKE